MHGFIINDSLYDDVHTQQKKGWLFELLVKLIDYDTRVGLETVDSKTRYRFAIPFNVLLHQQSKSADVFVRSKSSMMGGFILKTIKHTTIQSRRRKSAMIFFLNLHF